MSNSSDFATLIPLIQKELGKEKDDEIGSLIAKTLDEPLVRIFGIDKVESGIDFNSLITLFLPYLLAYIKSRTEKTIDKNPPPPIPVPVNPPIPPVITPPPTIVVPNVIQGYPVLKVGILQFSRKGTTLGRQEYNKIVAGVDGAQMVDDKVHMNISPFDLQGKEIFRDDPRHVTPDENGYPRIRYVYSVNGEVMQNSGNDIFNQGSIFSKNDENHRYDNGCTPTYRLLRQFGSGKGEVNFQAMIDEEFNGPYGYVESNVVSWFID